MLVRIVAGQGQRGLRIQELTAASGLTATTVFRMVQGLIREGVIERDARTHKLFLGRLVHELGLAARQTPLHDLCRDTLHGVARDTGCVVYLSDRSGVEAVCVDRAVGESPEPHWPLDVGLRSPLGIGVGGLAILSALQDETVLDVIQANSLRYRLCRGLTAAVVSRGVTEARRRGYARRNSVMVPGAVAIGVPFRYGVSVGAITVTALRCHLDARRSGRIVESLLAAKDRVEAAQKG